MANVVRKPGDASGPLTLDDVQQIAVQLRGEDVNTLDLEGVKIAPAVLERLLGTVAACKGLDNLLFSGCKIGETGCASFARLVIKCRHISRIDLSNNGVGDSGAAAFASALDRPGFLLQTLILRGNNIGDEGGRALFKALAKNTSLHSLDLAENQLGNDAAVELAKSLGDNASLVHLQIANNSIGLKGGMALAESLEGNHVVRTMDVSRNVITSQQIMDNIRDRCLYNASRPRRKEAPASGLAAAPAYHHDAKQKAAGVPSRNKKRAKERGPHFIIVANSSPPPEHKHPPEPEVVSEPAALPEVAIAPHSNGEQGVDQEQSFASGIMSSVVPVSSEDAVVGHSTEPHQPPALTASQLRPAPEAAPARVSPVLAPAAPLHQPVQHAPFTQSVLNEPVASMLPQASSVPQSAVGSMAAQPVQTAPATGMDARDVMMFQLQGDMMRLKQDMEMSKWQVQKYQMDALRSGTPEFRSATGTPVHFEAENMDTLRQKADALEKRSAELLQVKVEVEKKSNELADWLQEIVRREQTLSDRERTVMLTEAELEKKRATMRHHLSQLESKEESLADREEAIQNEKKEVESRKRILARKEDELRELMKEIDRRDEELVQKLEATQTQQSPDSNALRSNNMALRKELEKLQKKVDLMRSEQRSGSAVDEVPSQSQWTAESNSELVNLRVECDSLRHKLLLSEETIEKMRNDALDQTRKAVELQGKVDDLMIAKRSLEDVNENLRERSERAVAVDLEIKSLRRENEQQAETINLLQDTNKSIESIQASQVDAVRDEVRALNMLVEKQKVELEEARKHKPELAALNDEIATLLDQKAKLQEKTSTLDSKIERINKENENMRGLLREAEAQLASVKESSDERALSVDEELVRSKQTIARLEIENSKLEEENSALEARVNEADVNVKKERELGQMLSEFRDEATKNLENLKDALKKTVAEKGELERRLTDSKVGVAKSDAEVRKERDHVRRLERDLAEMSHMSVKVQHQEQANTILRNELSALREELMQCEDTLRKTDDERSGLQADIKILKDELEAARSDVASKRREVADGDERYEQVAHDRAALSREVLMWQKRSESHQETASNYRAELDRVKKTVTQLESSKLELEFKLDEKDMAMLRARSKADEELVELETQIDERDSQIISLKGEIKILTDELNLLKARSDETVESADKAIRDMIANATASENSIRELSDKLLEVEGARERIEMEAAAARRRAEQVIEDLNNKVTRLEDGKAELKHAVDEKDAAVAKLRDENSTMRKDLAEVQGLLTSIEKARESMLRELNAAKKEVEQTKHDAYKAAADHEAAVAGLQSQLKQLDKQRRDEVEIARRDLEYEMAQRHNLENRLQDKMDELNRTSAALHKTRHDNAEILRKVKDDSTEFDRKRSEVIMQAESDLETTRKKLDTAQMDIMRLEDEAKSLRHRDKQLTREAEDALASQRREATARADAEDRLRILEDSVNMLRIERDALVIEADESNSALKRERDSKVATLAETERLASSLREQNTRSGALDSHMKKEIDLLQTELRRARQERDLMQSELSILKEATGRSSLSDSRIQDELKALRDALKQERDEREKADIEIRSLRSHNDILRGIEEKYVAVDDQWKEVLKEQAMEHDNVVKTLRHERLELESEAENMQALITRLRDADNARSTSANEGNMTEVKHLRKQVKELMKSLDDARENERLAVERARDTKDRFDAELVEFQSLLERAKAQSKEQSDQVKKEREDLLSREQELILRETMVYRDLNRSSQPLTIESKASQRPADTKTEKTLEELKRLSEQNEIAKRNIVRRANEASIPHSVVSSSPPPRSPKTSNSPTRRLDPGSPSGELLARIEKHTMRMDKNIKQMEGGRLNTENLREEPLHSMPAPRHRLSPSRK